MLSGNNQEIHNELLHFMKCQSFLKHYKFLIRGNKNWCPFTHSEIIDIDCYNANEGIEILFLFLEKYQLCNQFLDSNSFRLKQLSQYIAKLHDPEELQTHKEFRKILDDIKEGIEDLDDEIQVKIHRLSCAECIRLDESLVNYSNHCLYSSVIMAVSAVELRLHRMIENLDNDRYNTKFKNFTLGQIFSLFLKDGEYEDIKKIMPKKHLPLIQLLNQYRIFAVHPKKQQITQSVAYSIISLAFTFLLDPEISAYTPEELACSSSE